MLLCNILCSQRNTQKPQQKNLPGGDTGEEHRGGKAASVCGEGVRFRSEVSCRNMESKATHIPRENT